MVHLSPEIEALKTDLYNLIDAWETLFRALQHQEHVVEKMEGMADAADS